MDFTVGQFRGPLEKLLELIESQKLGIDEVSLSKVTDDFLRYLDALKGQQIIEEASAPSGELPDETGAELLVFRGDLHMLADFIAIASRLILLKSKYLLPGLALTDDEEADIKDLENRLERYRDLRPMFRVLARLWRESHKSYSRQYFLGRGASFVGNQRVFHPGRSTDAEALRASLRGIFDTIVTYELETETIREKIVTLEEKIQEVLARITKGGDTHFGALSNERTRSEMVIVFLAILHLAREQLVRLEQDEHFSDIMVKQNIPSNPQSNG